MAETNQWWHVMLVVLVFACGTGRSGQDGTDVMEAEEIDMGDPECPELEWSDGASLRIESAEEALALPRYTRIDGHLRLVGVTDLTDLSFLECLREVNGNFTIISLPNLQSLAGLERLEKVSHASWPFGTLVLHDNPKLESIDALANLRYASRLTIMQNPLLTSLEPLVGLESAGDIEIWGNDSLETLGLRQLRSVDWLAIGSTYDCDGFLELDETSVTGNAALTEIDGLDALESFGYFSIMGNHNLVSLNGLLHLVDAEMEGFLVQFNSSLPYENILDVLTILGQSAYNVCSNLDDPKECSCIP